MRLAVLLRRLTAFPLSGLLLVWALAWPAYATPHAIRVGTFVTSISGVNPADGSFRIAAYLWTVDPLGQFDPETELEILGRNWTSRKIADRMMPDGSRYVAVLVEAVVDHQFDLHAYPFDQQSLTFSIESTSSAHSLVLSPDRADSRLADFLTVPGWTVRGLTLASDAHLYDTSFGQSTAHPTFSRLTISVDLKRNVSPLVIEKFAGFVVALIITALVFVVPVTELGTRIGMTTSSIFAAVFNRYRLEDAIGFDSVFGLVDQISLLTFSAILCALAASLWAHLQVARRGKVEATRVDVMLGSAVIGVHVLLMGLCLMHALR